MVSVTPPTAPEHVRNTAKCWAKSKRSQEQCKRNPVPGSTKCASHIGNKKARGHAAVRAEVSKWTLGSSDIDPGETLLRLLSQSRQRADMYAERLEAAVEEHGGDIVEAMVGESFVVGDNGHIQKVGEYIRGLAQLEADERDRCANFARLAIAAGLAERQVRLAEQTGALMATMIRAAMTDPDLALTDAQRAALPGVLRRHLQLVPVAG